jgi:type I restriction enzyme M protein
VAVEKLDRIVLCVHPSRYTGAGRQEDDDQPFEDRMWHLVTTLRDQQTEAARLDAAVAGKLEEMGIGK